MTFICLNCERTFPDEDMPAHKDEYTCPFCGSDNVEERNDEE